MLGTRKHNPHKEQWLPTEIVLQESPVNLFKDKPNLKGTWAYSYTSAQGKSFARGVAETHKNGQGFSRWLFLWLFHPSV